MIEIVLEHKLAHARASLVVSLKQGYKVLFRGRKHSVYVDKLGQSVERIVVIKRA